MANTELGGALPDSANWNFTKRHASCKIPNLMSEALKCDICGAPATIHLTQIVDGKMRKVHLCEKCAAKHKAEELPIIKFAEMITKKLFGEKLGKEILDGAVKSFDENEFSGGKKCPDCGTTAADFEKNERFGCPRCYSVFASELESILPKIQHAVAQDASAKSDISVGAKTLSAEQKTLSVEELERALSVAVAKQDYALAAKIRDSIRDLKNPPRPKRKAKAEKSSVVKTQSEKKRVSANRKKTVQKAAGMSAASAKKSANKKGKKQ